MSTSLLVIPSQLNTPWSTTLPLAVWSIWLARNKYVMEAQPFMAPTVMERIKILSQEITHTFPPKRPNMKNNVLYVGWNPPPFGFFKLNTDGSARGNPGLASAGSLIKDHNGMWIGSFCRNIGFTYSMAAELWGLRNGLSLAKNLNIKKLLI